MIERRSRGILLGVMMCMSGYCGIMFTALIASTTNLLPNYIGLMLGFCFWIVIGMLILVFMGRK